MPTRTRAVEVELAEAEKLADLYGVQFDLRNSAYLCEKAIEMSQVERPDSLAIEGLVSAAVVRYSRCFPSRARYGIRRKDLEDIEDGYLETHDYFKNLRDKFIAHSVNPFEETYVTASAREKDGVLLPITSLGGGQNRVVLSPSTAMELKALIAKVTKEVDKKVKSEEHRLLKHIQKLPLETIHSGDLHAPINVRNGDVGKTRRRGKKPKPAPKGGRA